MSGFTNNRDLLEFVELVATGIQRVNPFQLRSTLQKCSQRFVNLLRYKVKASQEAADYCTWQLVWL